MTCSVSLSNRWILCILKVTGMLLAVRRLRVRIERPINWLLALGEVDDDLRTHRLGDVDMATSVYRRRPGHLPVFDLLRPNTEDDLFVDVGPEVLDLAGPIRIESSTLNRLANNQKSSPSFLQDQR